MVVIYLNYKNAQIQVLLHQTAAMNKKKKKKKMEHKLKHTEIENQLYEQNYIYTLLNL